MHPTSVPALLCARDAVRHVQRSDLRQPAEHGPHHILLVAADASRGHGHHISGVGYVMIENRLCIFISVLSLSISPFSIYLSLSLSLSLCVCVCVCQSVSLFLLFNPCVSSFIPLSLLFVFWNYGGIHQRKKTAKTDRQRERGYHQKEFAISSSGRIQQRKRKAKEERKKWTVI